MPTVTTDPAEYHYGPRSPQPENRSQGGLEVESSFTFTEMLRFYIKILCCLFLLLLEKAEEGNSTLPVTVIDRSEA